MPMKPMRGKTLHIRKLIMDQKCRNMVAAVRHTLPFTHGIRGTEADCHSGMERREAAREPNTRRHRQQEEPLAADVNQGYRLVQLVDTGKLMPDAYPPTPCLSTHANLDRRSQFSLSSQGICRGICWLPDL